MLKWKAYFKNSSKRKRRYAKFIADKGFPAKKCPKPCTTRWLPWLEAVYWHSERIPYHREFLEKEPDTTDTSTKNVLLECLTPEIERSFYYLGSVAPTLLDWLISLQTNSRVGHHLMEMISDMRSFIVIQQKNGVYPEWSDMWSEMLSKFDQYFCWDGLEAPQ